MNMAALGQELDSLKSILCENIDDCRDCPAYAGSTMRICAISTVFDAMADVDKKGWRD